MENNNFCPFINGTCKSICVFRLDSSRASEHGATKCLIASKLDDINGYQYDQLLEIKNAIKEKTDK